MTITVIRVQNEERPNKFTATLLSNCLSRPGQSVTLIQSIQDSKDLSEREQFNEDMDEMFQ